MNMENTMNWALFLQPYEFAVDNFLLKFQFLKNQYNLKGLKNPIVDITGRVKTPSSIIEKLDRLNMPRSDYRELTDIGGVRITCKFIQDVYDIYELIKSRKDIQIVLVKDYIKYPKPSGYRSFHLIVKYSAETIDGQMPIYLEVQIRTLAMHLWASIEHSLKYKYYSNIPASIKERLKETSKIANSLDIEMDKIKSDIVSAGDELDRAIDEHNWKRLS